MDDGEPSVMMGLVKTRQTLFVDNWATLKQTDTIIFHCECAVNIFDNKKSWSFIITPAVNLCDLCVAKVIDVIITCHY